MPARRLRQLLLERGVVQFESQIPPLASLADLDPNKINAYLQVLEPAGRGTGARSAFTAWLFETGWGIYYARPMQRSCYSGIILSSGSPTPQSWRRVFSGVTLSEHYLKQDIGGALPDQLRQAEAFVQSNLRSVVRLVGLTHQETLEYPPEAARELLVNAVAHRDYNLQGDNIHLFIFADRIEIHSPGGLPGPVTLDNLLEALLARMLSLSRSWPILALSSDLDMGWTG